MLPKECYEFPDGKDTGQRNYVVRSLGADRVEVDKAIEGMKNEYSRNILDLNKDYENYKNTTQETE